MMKISSLAIIFAFTVLISGCATVGGYHQVENEPLCWDNINAKLNKLAINGQAPFSDVPFIRNMTGNILHVLAGTINPDCYSNALNSKLIEENHDRISPNPHKMPRFFTGFKVIQFVF